MCPIRSHRHSEKPRRRVESCVTLAPRCPRRQAPPLGSVGKPAAAPMSTSDGECEGQPLLPECDDGQDEPEGQPLLPKSERRGAPSAGWRWVALFVVPALWGSYTPVLKILVEHEGQPPVVLTNLASHAIGFVALLLLWCLQSGGSSMAGKWGSRRRTLLASFELGTYLFFGQLTQLLGLEGTSATSNAILVQSSVVVVPLLDVADSGSCRKHCNMANLARRIVPSESGVKSQAGSGTGQPAACARDPVAPAADARARRHPAAPRPALWPPNGPAPWPQAYLRSAASR